MFSTCICQIHNEPTELIKKIIQDKVNQFLGKSYNESIDYNVKNYLRTIVKKMYNEQCKLQDAFKEITMTEEMAKRTVEHIIVKKEKKSDKYIEELKQKINSFVLDPYLCSSCGRQVDEDDVCQTCEEYVCYDCSTPNTYMNPIERIECPSCKDSREMERWDNELI